MRLKRIRTTRRIFISRTFDFLRMSIPAPYETVIFKDTKFEQYAVVVYGDVYCFRFLSPKNVDTVAYDKQTNSVVTRFYSLQNEFTLYFLFITKIFKTLSCQFFRRIKFKGKGYRIYKNKKNYFGFQFGHSHRIIEYAYDVASKKISKQLYLLYGPNWLDVDKVAHNFRRWRPINIYTGRGMRFGKQIVYKKKGKVSTYR